MDQQQLSEVYLKLDQIYDTSTKLAIPQAQNKIGKLLAASPGLKLPLAEADKVVQPFFERKNDPLQSKQPDIKMDIINLLRYENYFKIEQEDRKLMVQLIVEKVLEFNVPSDWKEEEDEKLPTKTQRNDGQQTYTRPFRPKLNQSTQNIPQPSLQNYGYQIDNTNRLNRPRDSSEGGRIQDTVNTDIVGNRLIRRQRNADSQSIRQVDTLQRLRQSSSSSTNNNFYSTIQDDSQVQRGLYSQDQNEVVSQRPKFDQFQAQRQECDYVQDDFQQATEQNGSLDGQEQFVNRQYPRRRSGGLAKYAMYRFSLKRIENVAQLQDLLDYFKINKYKHIGFDAKVVDKLIEVLSFSTFMKGEGDCIVAVTWYLEYGNLSVHDRKNANIIVQSMWADKMLVCQNAGQFGSALFVNFEGYIPEHLWDLQVMWQQHVERCRLLCEEQYGRFPADSLWAVKGKPQLYGMLEQMKLVPATNEFEDNWRRNRTRIKWQYRPYQQSQLDVIKEDVGFLLPLYYAIKEKDKKMYNSAVVLLSKAHIYWNVPLVERPGNEQGTLTRNDKLKVNMEYEMKFTKLMVEGKRLYTPEFYLYSKEGEMTVSQCIEDEELEKLIVQKVSSVPGQDFLDSELESVFKVLSDDVVVAIVEQLIPQQLLQQSLIYEDDERNQLVQQALCKQKSLVEITYDFGENEINLRTKDDEWLTVDKKLNLLECITNLKNAMESMKKEIVLKDLFKKIYLQERDNELDSCGDVCSLQVGPNGGHPPFRADNRLGLPGSLHRVSVTFGPTGNDVSGIIFRIGRHLPGAALPFMDLLSDIAKASQSNHSNNLSEKKVIKPSILIMGQPGVGKTTLLRDIAYQLSKTFGIGKGVAVIDSSMEMGGESLVAHPCLGKAKRVAVANRSEQYKVLQTVVQNVNPRVLIVDEVRDEQEVKAIRDISQRGVIMIATIHGDCLEELLKNQVLSGLVGGVRSVTIGDIEAKISNQGVKTRLERGGAPICNILIEVQSTNRWKILRNVGDVIDNMLAQKPMQNEIRTYNQDAKQVIFKIEGQKSMEESRCPVSVGERTWLEDLGTIKKVVFGTVKV